MTPTLPGVLSLIANLVGFPVALKVAEVFGKPAAIRIRFGDGTVYRGGHFTPAQDFRDFGKRLKCALQRFNSTLSDGQNESDTLGPSMTNRWR